MYKKGEYRILSNRRLSPKSWLMVLEGDTQYITSPGQFVNVAVEGKFLRRPISLCDYDDRTITLLYDVVGEGTRWMSERREGEMLDLLTGLGNGFNIAVDCKRPALLGGGVGNAPMLRLAKDLVAKGVRPAVVLGYNTAEDVVLVDEFRATGADVYVATADGTMGTRGFVTDTMKEEGIDADYFFACGPMPMLKAMCRLPIPGQLSLDERMACGFGACMCCSVETAAGPRRICKDGPVFRKEELIWK